MLKTIRYSIDLGYNDLAINKKIKDVIPSILILLVKIINLNLIKYS